MINSHAHLDFESMNTIAENAVAIVPSIGKQNWQVVQMYPYFALGIHPCWAPQHGQNDLEQLQYLVKCNNPIAIGACGLDFTRDIDQQRQYYFFEEQLKIAQFYHLPVIIHAAESTAAVILLLKKYPKISGVIHGFSGSETQAQSLVRMGFYLGFGMQVTQTRSTELRKIAQNMPLESLLIETDDHPNPEDLTQVGQAIADLRQITFEQLIQQCDDNAIKLFGLR